MTPPGSPLDNGARVGALDEEDGIGMSEIRGKAREALLSGERESDALEGGRVTAKSTNGGVRFCRKCNVPKPDR